VALAEYNDAVKKYESAKSQRQLGAMEGSVLGASTDGLTRLIGVANALGSQAGLNQAEGAVEVARQKLERARDRLNNIER
jgi:hypothetical protein